MTEDPFQQNRVVRRGPWWFSHSILLGTLVGIFLFAFLWGRLEWQRQTMVVPARMYPVNTELLWTVRATSDVPLLWRSIKQSLIERLGREQFNGSKEMELIGQIFEQAAVASVGFIPDEHGGQSAVIAFMLPSEPFDRERETPLYRAVLSQPYAAVVEGIVVWSNTADGLSRVQATVAGENYSLQTQLSAPLDAPVSLFIERSRLAPLFRFDKVLLPSVDQLFAPSIEVSLSFESGEIRFQLFGLRDSSYGYTRSGLVDRLPYEYVFGLDGINIARDIFGTVRGREATNELLSVLAYTLSAAPSDDFASEAAALFDRAAFFMAVPTQIDGQAYEPVIIFDAKDFNQERFETLVGAAVALRYPAIIERTLPDGTTIEELVANPGSFVWTRTWPDREGQFHLLDADTTQIVYAISDGRGYLGQSVDGLKRLLRADGQLLDERGSKCGNTFYRRQMIFGPPLLKALFGDGFDHSLTVWEAGDRLRGCVF